MRARRLRFSTIVVLVLLLMFGVPWWTLVYAPDWPSPVTITGTALFAAVLVAFPTLMFQGHSRRARDWAARIGDTTLGVIWVLFAWSVLSLVPRLALLGVGEPARSRIVA